MRSICNIADNMKKLPLIFDHYDKKGQEEKNKNKGVSRNVLCRKRFTAEPGKKTSFISLIDEKGKVIAQANLPNREETILKYFANLGGETEVVIESTCSWYWLYDLFSAKRIKVLISNSARTKAIASARIKNEKANSYMMAEVLRADLIAPIYMNSLEIRRLKELLLRRARLVRDITPA